MAAGFFVSLVDPDVLHAAVLRVVVPVVVDGVGVLGDDVPRVQEAGDVAEHAEEDVE